MELKGEMVGLELLEYQYFDDILTDMKLTPVRIISTCTCTPVCVSGGVCISNVIPDIDNILHERDWKPPFPAGNASCQYRIKLNGLLE